MQRRIGDGMDRGRAPEDGVYMVWSWYGYGWRRGKVAALTVGGEPVTGVLGCVGCGVEMWSGVEWSGVEWKLRTRWEYIGGAEEPRA